MAIVRNEYFFNTQPSKIENSKCLFFSGAALIMFQQKS